MQAPPPLVQASSVTCGPTVCLMMGYWGALLGQRFFRSHRWHGGLGSIQEGCGTVTPRPGWELWEEQVP